MQHEFIRFDSRQDRPRFFSERFAPALVGNLLDVGCDAAILRDFVGPERYTGIDISDAADIRLNLMQADRLPFDDATFDIVMCTDVLEHLENLHLIFDELVRVSCRHVLVSLPNNWNSARRRLRRGKGSIAHYGLPLTQPVDRHRWFFSLLEARDFLVAGAERHGLQVEDLIALERPRPPVVRAWRRLVSRNEETYLNLFAHTVVAVMRKTVQS